MACSRAAAASADLPLKKCPLSEEMKSPVRLEDEELYQKLAAAVSEQKLGVQAEPRKQGRRFKGVDQVRVQGWKDVARSVDERFAVTPKVAASCMRRRLAQLQRDREWEREYAAARALLQAGEPAFPAGTYWLRRCWNP
jgi:hypothetical protein